MKSKRNLLLAIICCVCIAQAEAVEPLNTDDAGTVKKNTNQIEMYFYGINKVNQTSGPGQDSVSPGEEFSGAGSAKTLPIVYTRGITDDIEMGIGSHYNFTPRGDYSPVSNYALGAKWRFLGTEGEGLNLAVKPYVQFPLSVQQQVAGFGQAAFNYGVTMIASHYFNEQIEVHVNIGYVRSPYNVNYLNGGSATPLRLNQYLASIAPIWSVMDGLRLAIDVGVQTNPPATEQQSVMYGMLAAIVGITDDLDFGISMLRSAQNSAQVLTGSGPNSTRLDVGFTWRFE
jgi:hypothetical protein